MIAIVSGAWQRCPERCSRPTKSATAGRLLQIVLIFGLVLTTGCGDDGKFRPKVGGGLKRDVADDPSPAVPPIATVSPQGPSVTTPRAAGDDAPEIQTSEEKATAPPSSSPTNPAAANVAPVVRQRRSVPIRRSGGEAAPLSSQMQLECNGKLLIRPLSLKQLLQAPDRKTVWLLTSSAAEDRVRAPAVCVRFETEGEDPDHWLGRPLSGQMFVQMSDARQVLGSALEGEVRLEFSVWDDAGVEGRILPGELQSSSGEKSVPYEGTFIATTEVSAAPEGESE